MVVLTCLSLLGYCIALRHLSKWPITVAPFFIISSIITLLYIFAYLDFLKTGTSIILIVGGFLLLCAPFFLWKEKKVFWETNATPGFVINLGFIALFLTLARYAHFSYWDEFAQWGPHTKLVYFHNGLIRASDITVHKAYPLGGALFQYLFFRLSGFSEGVAYVAQCLLTMAPLMILFTRYRWAEWRHVFIFYTVTLVALFLLKIKMGPDDTLYMDGVVSIYVGMMLVAYLSSEKRAADIFYLIPMSAVLVTFKMKLLPFVLLVSVVILIDQCFLHREKCWPRCLAIASLPISAILMTTSWHHYLHTIQVPSEWALRPVFSPLTETQPIIINHYFHALIPAMIFIVLILMVTGFIYIRYQNMLQKRTLIIIQTTMLIGFIAYISGILLLYLFSFSPYEATRHLSMYRYLHIYEIAWLLVTGYFLLNALKSYNFQFSKHVSNVFIISIFVGTILYLSGFYFFHHQRADSKIITKIAGVVSAKTSVHAKIFAVWQHSQGLKHAILAYALIPRTLNLDCTSFGKPYDAKDVWTCQKTPQQFSTELHGFDFLLLAHTDSKFWRQYQSVLPKQKNLKPIYHDAFGPVYLIRLNS